MRSIYLQGALILIILSGCDEASMMKKMTPPEDESIAKSYINLLRENKFELIEKDLDPSIKSADIHDLLGKMAAMIPAQEPTSVKVVSVNVLKGADFSGTNITFEYQFPETWLLVNVATQKKDGVFTIVGFHVNPIPDSLENLNKFTLMGKSPIQYTTLALAVVVPLFSLYVLVLCIRTKIEKRKWLWVIFIVLGVGKFSVDWTTGQWEITPLAVQLFGTGAFAPPYGTWVVSVSLPLGAIAFLYWQNKRGESVEQGD